MYFQITQIQLNVKKNLIATRNNFKLSKFFKFRITLNPILDVMRVFFEPKPDIIPRERMSVWIESDLKKNLKQVADFEGVSLNHVCRVFLDLMVAEYETNERRNEVYGESPWLYD